MKILYKYTLDDFDVVKTNILKNFNSQSDRTLGNGDMVPAFEIYRIGKWLNMRLSPPIVRFETLDEVIEYLKNETGETAHFDELKLV